VVRQPFSGQNEDAARRQASIAPGSPSPASNQVRTARFLVGGGYYHGRNSQDMDDGAHSTAKEPD
jgi:hypothetical protein